MKKYYNARFNETYYQEVLSNGLTIYLMPKEDYSVSYAILATKYGSLDNEFMPIDKSEYVKVPLGIAHFLEHKMFEMPNNCDVNSMFAKIGADVNAYTTYNHTGYFFSTTRNFEKALNLLLDFVQVKGYTQESVQEEMGIIEQELLMYLDNPNIRLQIEAYKTMYQNNLVREDIGGTCQSIRDINKELLDLCYDNFYNPHNMCLVLVGKFDVDKTLQLILDNQRQKVFNETASIKRKYYVESSEVFQTHKELKMDVLIPKVSVNLKIGYEELVTEELIKKDYAISALMYQEFDVTSDFFQKLEKEKIINNSFDFDVIIEDTYSHITITTDTNMPNKFISEVVNHLLKMKDIMVSYEVFERYKKITEAQILRKMNSVEYFGNMLIESHFHNIELFKNLEIIKNLKYEDVQKVRKYFIPEAISGVIIRKED